MKNAKKSKLTNFSSLKRNHQIGIKINIFNSVILYSFFIKIQ